ncbi:MAG: exo-alpha-sialidase [Fimbriimonadaceae bacterium]|nr:exo-alpha-sialidase [Fimbriimonadaceae bacterium]
MRRTAFWIVISLAAILFAQDPVVGPQVRIGNDALSNSSNETSASAVTSDGSEIVGGWNDYRTDGTIKSGFAVSSDFGSSWANVIVRPPVANQTTVEGDPMACHDPRTGTLWAGGMAFGGNGGIYVARKNVGSNTFQPSVMARISGSVDKGWMAAGPQPGNPNSTRMYITYNQGSIRSDNLGATWTSPVSLGSGIGFLPRVGPQGQLYVTYWDFSNGVMLRRSLDGGSTFGAPIRIATRMDVWSTEFNNIRFPGSYRVPPIHTMAVDPASGHLYVVYFDTTNIIGGNRNVDLYFVKSVNEGVTWTTPMRMPFRALNTVGDQFFPWLEVDDRGRLQLLYFDTQNTVQNDGSADGFLDQYYAYSDDGGSNWSKFRLTPQSFNARLDGRNSSTSFMGDYQGIGFGGRYVYPVYLSTITSQAEIYTNVIYDPVIWPASASVIRGEALAGNRASLNRNDDDRLVVRRGLTLNAQEAPVNVEMTANSLASPPASARIFVRSLASTANLEQRVEAFDLLDQEWETLDTRVATTSETVTDVAVPDPSRYFTPATGTIRYRVTYRAIGPTATALWTLSLDQAVVIAVP